MKPEEQRVAIAKACGWQFIPEYCNGEDQPPEFTTVTPDGRHLCGYYPDYLNDLNAMNEAITQHGNGTGKTVPPVIDRGGGDFQSHRLAVLQAMQFRGLVGLAAANGFQDG